jgi:hypothetical protein
MIETDPTTEKQQRDGSGRQSMIANEPSRLGDQTQIAVCGAQRQHVVAGAILARRGSVSGGDMPSKCLSSSHAPRFAWSV